LRQANPPGYDDLQLYLDWCGLEPERLEFVHALLYHNSINVPSVLFSADVKVGDLQAMQGITFGEAVKMKQFAVDFFWLKHLRDLEGKEALA
jgi:hypothetical protein